MTPEQVKQAEQAINALYQVARLAPVAADVHDNSRQAGEFLIKLVRENNSDEPSVKVVETTQENTQ